MERHFMDLVIKEKKIKNLCVESILSGVRTIHTSAKLKCEIFHNLLRTWTFFMHKMIPSQMNTLENVILHKFILGIWSCGLFLGELLNLCSCQCISCVYLCGFISNDRNKDFPFSAPKVNCLLAFIIWHLITINSAYVYSLSIARVGMGGGCVRPR